MFKTCPNCEKNLSVESFSKDSKRKDKLTVYCTPCNRIKCKATYHKFKYSYKEYSEKRKEENRLFLWKYKLTHPCIDCGEKDPRVLQFDHVRGIKDKEITYLAYSRKVNIKSLEKEIEKCDVRCANCHMKKTWDTLEYKIPNLDVEMKNE